MYGGLEHWFWCNNVAWYSFNGEKEGGGFIAFQLDTFIEFQSCQIQWVELSDTNESLINESILQIKSDKKK